MTKPKKEKVEDHIFDDMDSEDIVYNVSITGISTSEGASNCRDNTWEGRELFTVTLNETTECELQRLAKNIRKVGKEISLLSASY